MDNFKYNIKGNQTVYLEILAIAWATVLSISLLTDFQDVISGIVDSFR